MEIEVKLPLDSDGFIRRECPSCELQFKWHDGPANAQAETQESTSSYFCPFCGVLSGTETWWTQEQIDFLEQAQGVLASRVIDEGLNDLFGGLRNTKHVRFERSGPIDHPDMPEPLVEVDDMTIVTSPCHAWEPVKVPDGASGPLHCFGLR